MSLESLQQKLWCRKLCYFFEVCEDQSPASFFSLILFSIRTYQTRNARDIRYFNRNHKFFTTNITLNCYVATRIKYITYLRLGLNHPNTFTHQLSRCTYSFLGLRFWNINISTLYTPLSCLSKGKNCGNLEWGNSYFIRLFD